jgi:hypothetical protein
MVSSMHQKVLVTTVTQVLQSCGCGDIRTVQLNGEWTSAELDRAMQG